MPTLRAMVPVILMVLAVPATGMAADATCQDLLKLSAANTAITLAEQVPAGGFQSQREAQGGPNAARFSALPGFCRVAATLTPTPDSDIKIEVWLPSSGWNGKFQAVGNGGWAGALSYPAMALALSRGYATASTDTGHSTPGAGFAMGHPEKLHDYVYRAVHEMTVTAKTVINAFYGSVPARSYFNGCSTGGRQGLIEASRYPEDFDGVIAGAAANPKTRLDTWRIWMALETLREPHKRIPQEKYPAIHNAVLAACDGLDGVTDGLIADPPSCRFDARVLACKNGDGPHCLTEGQIQSVTTILGPARSPRTGAEIFPGYAPGTELRWDHLIGGPDPYETAIEQFRMVFTDPNWDWRSFDVDRDMARTEEALGGLLTGIDPASIRPFIDRGGKLLTYHGWADQSIAPMASVNFFTAASAALGAEKATSSLRLFMVPGMGHCGGGEGPNTFDMMAPLEQWVENGQPPSRVVASHSTSGRVERTRPLCAYPAVARHTGTGSTDDAENFVCQEQPPASASPARIVTDVRDVTITVSDLARSLAFYRTLGFESTGSSILPPRAPLGPEFSMLPGAPTTARVRAVVLTIPGNGFALRLVEFSGVGRKATPSRMQDVGAVRFGVVVRRIDATFAELTKIGAPVVTQAGSPVLFPQGGGGTVRAVALRDPDGVLIELLQIDPAPATGAAASGRVLNARFVVCARDAFQSLGFYQTVFGLEQEKIAFWDPEKKPIRVEWNASPGSLNVFDTPAAQFRFVLGHFPGLPDLWEFTEYKDIERRQLRPDVFDPGAIVLSLTVRDLDAVLRAFQASGGTLVSSRGQDGRGSQGVVFVRDLDGLLLELIAPRVN